MELPITEKIASQYGYNGGASLQWMEKWVLENISNNKLYLHPQSFESFMDVSFLDYPPFEPMMQMDKSFLKDDRIYLLRSKAHPQWRGFRALVVLGDNTRLYYDQNIILRSLYFQLRPGVDSSGVEIYKLPLKSFDFGISTDGNAAKVTYSSTDYLSEKYDLLGYLTLHNQMPRFMNWNDYPF